MKRIIQHPPREKRPKMWRSIGELENSPEFEEVLHREFPRGADVYEDSGLSRRDFMKLLGASMTLAGVGLTGCRRPESYLVPFTNAVEFTIPGKNLYYATAMPSRGGIMPLVATTVDGRPIKIEGNPVHPDSNGATNGFAQASVLDLYDPHRSRSIKKGDQAVAREELDALLASIAEKYRGNGAGLAFLAEPDSSPTRARLQSELQTAFPSLLWAEYDPLGDDNARAAVAAAFGKNVVLQPNFDAADVLLSLDSDFLNAGLTGPSFARDFYKRRSADQEDLPMNRLYVAEPAFSVTGGMADHRIAVPASKIAAFTRALAAEIAEVSGDPLLASLSQNADASGFEPGWVKECAADLLDQNGRSVVLVGSQQPVDVQLLGLAINRAIGAFGRTLLPLQAPEAPTAASISDLAEKIQVGEIKTLFVLGSNPAYTAPADLEFAKLLKSVPEVVHWGLFEDETSALSAWHIPAAHYLESWGDGRTLGGVYTPIQPMILPLWDGIPEWEVYSGLLGTPRVEGPALLRETFTTIGTAAGADVSDMGWNEFLRNGFLPDTGFGPASAQFSAENLRSLYAAVGETKADGLDVVFLPSSSLDDGRYANNSWLQETPDFVTKITWDNALLVSPEDAKLLEMRDGDVMTVSAGGRSIDIAGIIAPGQAKGSFGIALGYGRKNVSALMENVGFDAYPLRTAAGQRFVTGVQVVPVAKKYTFARTQEHSSMEGRDLAREGTLELYRKHPDFVKEMGEFAHLTPLVQQSHQLFDNNFLTAEEQWAMAVDLNVCTGCNACLVACRAENNVPVVGKDQVNRGRDMAWIRIDRWFAGEPENPEMIAQAITCQQCENAPCETVCPVNATVHSEDGLNLMAYNRCIGTRYCANNCPWKVRRFNFFDYNERPIDKLYWGPLAKKGMADSLKMSKNPNVTVRMRGVMEKCTFCIQRIEEAKIARLVQAGPTDKKNVPVGPFQVACQQACPSDAITFGNQNDPESRIARLRKADRGYTMFGYVNARPRITYLGRIKNPNPKMPGAELVGRINSSGHDAGGHGGDSSEHMPSGVNHGPAMSNS